MNQWERFNNELLSFLWKNKWLWGAPMIIILLGLVILTVFGPSQPNRPFMHSIF
jgi:hypothetical protein